MFNNIPQLTKRQVEVMELACQGLTDKSIAERLVISMPTVKSHMVGIYNRLTVCKTEGYHTRIIAILKYKRLKQISAIWEQRERFNEVNNER